MRDLLYSRGIGYLHFIQPTQFFSTGKALSEEEQNFLSYSNARYKNSVAHGYSSLINNINRLKKNKVNIYDATTVFDKTQETVYRDDCIHYTTTGSRIFTEFVAEKTFLSYATSVKKALP